MRHRNKGRKLGRTASHRAATLKALSTSLFKYKRIKTTLAKAKEARGFAEQLITKAKGNTLHARRHVMQFINDKEVVNELFHEIVPKIGERPGGYTRVIKLGKRLGDAAEMAIIELVDYNAVINEKKTQAKEIKEEKKKEKESKEAEASVVPEQQEVAEAPAEEKK